MTGPNGTTRSTQGSAIVFWHRRWRALRAPSALLGITVLVTACRGGGGDADGGLGGGSGLGGASSSEEKAVASSKVLDLAAEAADLSEEDLNAAIAAADLDAQMALAQKSGLVGELGGEAATRALLANVGLQMQVAVEELESGALFGGSDAQSVPKSRLLDPKWPGVPVLAAGGAGVGEAFGAGWLGGSLFNGAFVGLVASDYASGKTGIDTGGSAIGDVTATAALSDTMVTLDATANFSLSGLSATIQTHSGIPCPDNNGLWTVNSSLDITGKAGNAYQSARFSFELIVEVDDDARLTGKNQLKSRTESHTADSSAGYVTTDASSDVSITEFADGNFGDAHGTYQGMTEGEATGWLNMGLMSGTLYRNQLLPHLQTMLEAGRCVSITVEPSLDPMDLEPFTNVDLLTKPRAKSGNTSATTGGTVQAKFKVSAGGSIAELGSKVPADATFHYISPLDYDQTETVTFESRSKRGTGKLDYTLTTSPHAD